MKKKATRSKVPAKDFTPITQLLRRPAVLVMITALKTCQCCRIDSIDHG